MDPEPGELIPTRGSLLSRLKDWEDQDSWRSFFDTYWKLIYGVATKAGLSDAEAQDVVQDTVLSVAKKMPEFKYDPAAGSFKGWLLQLTRWRILNQLKKRMPTQFVPEREATSDEHRSRQMENGGEAGLLPLEQIADPAGLDLEACWEEEWQKNLLEAALQRLKERAKPKQYAIFHLHVVKKLSVQETAKTLGVSLMQVHLAKHRLGVLLKREVRRLEREML